MSASRSLLTNDNDAGEPFGAEPSLMSSGAGELGGALDGWPDADNALPAADAQLWPDWCATSGPSGGSRCRLRLRLDDHRLAMPQITAVNGQFSTHR